jgi:hypothetical protein
MDSLQLKTTVLLQRTSTDFTDIATHFKKLLKPWVRLPAATRTSKEEHSKVLRLLLGAVNFLREIDTKTQLAAEHQQRPSGQRRAQARSASRRHATQGALCAQLELEHLALARAALACNMPLTALRNVETYCEKRFGALVLSRPASALRAGRGAGASADTGAGAVVSSFWDGPAATPQHEELLLRVFKALRDADSIKSIPSLNSSLRRKLLASRPADREGSDGAMYVQDAASFLLCTVTFYTNHAHNLTRSP